MTSLQYSPNIEQKVAFLQRDHISSDDDLIEYDASPKSYRLMLALMFLPIGFDFKDRNYFSNPLLIQFIIVGLALVGFVGLLVTNTNSNTLKLPKSEIYIRTWQFFIVYTIGITAIRSNIDFEFLRAIFPYLMMLFAMIAAIRHMQSNYDPREILFALAVTLIISLFWTYYFGRLTSGYASDSEFAFIEDIRYSVISSGLLALLAHILCQFSKRKHLIINSILAIFIVFVIVISKTRSMLTGLVLVLPFIVLASRDRMSAAINLLLPAIATLSVGIALPYLLTDIDIIEVWKMRLGGLDDEFVDVTYYTRLAEWVGEINLLLADIQSAVFGEGIITKFYWDPAIYDFLTANGITDDYFDLYTTGVHSTWLNVLFTSGLIVGWIPFFGFASIILIAIKICRSNVEIRSRIGDDFGICVAIILIHIIPMSFASVFIDRLYPFVLGVTSIYVVATWERRMAILQENAKAGELTKMAYAN